MKTTPTEVGLYALAAVGLVAILTATSLAALVGALKFEDRRIRQNRELTKRTGVRGALDAAADRGAR